MTKHPIYTRAAISASTPEPAISGTCLHHSEHIPTESDMSSVQWRACPAARASSNSVAIPAKTIILNNYSRIEVEVTILQVNVAHGELDAEPYQWRRMSWAGVVASLGTQFSENSRVIFTCGLRTMSQQLLSFDTPSNNVQAILVPVTCS
jgi:hypothetical protein